jgi:hypothetical protein
LKKRSYAIRVKIPLSEPTRQEIFRLMGGRVVVKKRNWWRIGDLNP